MKKVELYTSPFCGYCSRAKQLLKSKGVRYSETDVMRNPNRRAEMMKRSNGGRTVPQIFIGDKHVGGCDELFALERDGKLDKMLAA